MANPIYKKDEAELLYLKLGSVAWSSTGWALHVPLRSVWWVPRIPEEHTGKTGVLRKSSCVAPGALGIQEAATVWAPQGWGDRAQRRG